MEAIRIVIDVGIMIADAVIIYLILRKRGK